MAEVRERWEIGGGRGDPDAILQRIREEEEAGEAERFEGRGRLKVFFGYAAGVGKTFAMLTEAHHVQDEGVDVVVGYVEPHTRADTLALLDGLEVLPVKSVKHRNVALREFDLDAALKRRPQVVLVDELAHTNAPGCRHRKRYQDVEELLRAGIDVYTTVNVQHLEGLNDKIASVTAVAPSERIPDRVFDAADSVEVVDLEPADLIKRLRSGKIYAPERIGSALSHFFSRSNLAALREIALRRAADRLTRASAATVPHAAGGEDVLVLVTADAAAPRVIRAAAGMAEAFGGSCTALVVESGGEGVEGRSKGDAALARSIALAEEMGAHIVTLTGDDPVQPVALYAAAAGIRRIVVPSMPGRIGLLGCGDVASRLMRAAPEAMVTAVPAVDAPSVLERLRTHASFRLTASDVFRALLASISGDADMLLASGDVLDEAQRKRLTSDIHEDANWLINLVENLLSVTRLDDGDVEVSRAPELVSDVLADALRHVSRFVSEHRLTVEIEDEFLLAQMDGRLIVQVVVNLLNNAIAYTPAGSSIRLTAHRERSASGDRVVVAVADDGPGIPPAEQARVFDLFYHGGRVGTGCEDGEGGDARRGMGLGLSLCRSILRAHGSDIVLRDAYPHGCVFSFALPAAELREEAPVGVVEEGSADDER